MIFPLSPAEEEDTRCFFVRIYLIRKSPCCAPQRLSAFCYETSRCKIFRLGPACCLIKFYGSLRSNRDKEVRASVCRTAQFDSVSLLRYIRHKRCDVHSLRRQKRRRSNSTVQTLAPPDGQQPVWDVSSRRGRVVIASCAERWHICRDFLGGRVGFSNPFISYMSFRFRRGEH